MKNVRRTSHSLPYTRRLTIVAQDPSVRIGSKILTAEVDVPAENLIDGPCGYRVNVVDYDTTNNVLYVPAKFERDKGEAYVDPFSVGKISKNHNETLLTDPRFHAQNVYAIVMRTLARFEFALGRRVEWGSDGHQLHIAPHAFAEANAFYSKEDRGIFFGYFFSEGKPVYTCLSHDVVAHETTHAILDGLRGRYLEPSSSDQAAFHEAFADIVALLSVFSLKDVVSALLDMDKATNARLVDQRHLTRDKLAKSVLLGLADEMGEALSRVRGEALRRSVQLAPGKDYMSMPEYQESHARGELLVAAVMNAFLEMWLSRLSKIGVLERGKKDRSLVVDEGARVADHLLTMCIRAIDYCPPTDITFTDYLSALLTIDREVVPDDTKYGYRQSLLDSFKAYGIKPDEDADDDGTWQRCQLDLIYSRTHFESMLHDKEEVFRFLWENRKSLEITKDGYVEVESVRPSYRIGPDGFILHETVAEYVQILTLRAEELKPVLNVDPPKGMAPWYRVRVFGGGALIFNEYGQLKYQIRNRIEAAERQTARLQYLWDAGFFDEQGSLQSNIALRHIARALS